MVIQLISKIRYIYTCTQYTVHSRTDFNILQAIMNESALYCRYYYSDQKFVP